MLCSSRPIGHGVAPPALNRRATFLKKTFLRGDVDARQVGLTLTKDSVRLSLTFYVRLT